MDCLMNGREVKMSMSAILLLPAVLMDYQIRTVNWDMSVLCVLISKLHHPEKYLRELATQRRIKKPVYVLNLPDPVNRVCFFPISKIFLFFPPFCRQFLILPPVL